jgi:hypothetical protein
MGGRSIVDVAVGQQDEADAFVLRVPVLRGRALLGGHPMQNAQAWRDGGIAWQSLQLADDLKGVSLIEFSIPAAAINLKPSDFLESLYKIRREASRRALNLKITIDEGAAVLSSDMREALDIAQKSGLGLTIEYKVFDQTRPLMSQILADSATEKALRAGSSKLILVSSLGDGADAANTISQNIGLIDPRYRPNVFVAGLQMPSPQTPDMYISMGNLTLLMLQQTLGLIVTPASAGAYGAEFIHIPGIGLVSIIRPLRADRALIDAALYERTTSTAA